MSSSTEVTAVDVAVIGLGSAGERLATKLAETGRSVVGFDPGRIGGECPFTACMPSKVLLHHAASHRPVWAVARAHRDDVVNDLDDSGHHGELVDAGVEVVRARAAMVEEHVVEADGRRWRADTVVIATGSDPVIPPIDGLDGDRVWTSDDFMTATQLPESLIVVGGGAIGCESAAIMAGFGRRVALVEAEDALLGGSVDPLVSDLLAERLRRSGVDVHVGSSVGKVTHGDDDLVRLGDGTELSGARLLLATGQSPNWSGIGLESVGVGDRPEVDGEQRVDGRAWLRAIGDVDGRAPWTHGANHEADRLVELLTGQQDVRADVSGMPNCVFTDPPVGSVGSTAQAARDAGLSVVTGTARYSDVARYSTDRLFDGAVVVVAESGSGRIVGCSGIGAHFDDVVSVVTALMVGGVTVGEAARMVIPFPTMAQILTPAFAAAAH